MANIQKKKPTTYTYESVDGTKTTIQVGKDGVTKKWLALLMEDDAAVREQDDVQRKHTDYGYQNAVSRYERCPDDESGHPMDEIPDPAADIFRILYPEETADSRSRRLSKAAPLLCPRRLLPKPLPVRCCRHYHQAYLQE